MNRRICWPCAFLPCIAVALGGCQAPRDAEFRDSQAHYQGVITRIEYPDADVEHRGGIMETPPPHTVLGSGPIEYMPLSLEDAVRIALQNSRVMRDIGGVILSAPTTAVTVYDPAVRETDPRGGVEAALSAFDAQFTTNAFWGQSDQFYNNIFAGLGHFGLTADYANFEANITKTAATGTQFTMRNITTFERDDALLNLFPHFYTTVFEAEIRHPLLQGGGIDFNRIAGPGAKPGQYNGVLIGRINTDITLADFEAAVRDLLNNVERAYWELYVAYRDLDARTAGREEALEGWRAVQRKFDAGTADRELEARTREQYYAFDTQVVNALSGVAPMGQTGGSGGVYGAERRLRWVLGLPPSDGRLIRPAEEPSNVAVAFDWYQSLQEALVRRVELRRQKWMIKRRELELIAAKNFLHMRLDVVGQYRWRGAGGDLFGDTDQFHGSAFEDLLNGDLQEWQLGLQLATPIGNRIGHTTVRNAEYLLSRDRAIYCEQELRVSHELSDAIGELDRAYAATRALFNARVAAHQQLDEFRKKYEAGLLMVAEPLSGTTRTLLELLLQAQRRAVEADSSYYRSLAEYNVAIVAIHRARGSLLDYYNVYLNEGPSSEEAHRSAAKQARRFCPRVLNYCFERPCPVSQGPFDQRFAVGDQPPTVGQAMPIPQEQPMRTEGGPLPSPPMPPSPQPAPVGPLPLDQQPAPLMPPPLPQPPPPSPAILERQQPVPYAPVPMGDQRAPDQRPPAIVPLPPSPQPPTAPLPRSQQPVPYAPLPPGDQRLPAAPMPPGYPAT